MYNNINNSLKILAGNDYRANEWFIYNDGKQTLQCKVITDKATFHWANVELVEANPIATSYQKEQFDSLRTHCMECNAPATSDCAHH